MVRVGVYSFEPKIASSDYHLYKETSWSMNRNRHEVKVEFKTNHKSQKVDPYVCVIRAKEEFFKKWKTVRHILRVISVHVYYFLLKFLCYKQTTFEKMKIFVQFYYDYNFMGGVIEDSSDEEDEMTIDMVRNLHPHGDQQLIECIDFIGTVTKEANLKKSMKWKLP